MGFVRLSLRTEKHLGAPSWWILRLDFNFSALWNHWKLSFDFQLFLLDFLASRLLRRKCLNRKADVKGQACLLCFSSLLILDLSRPGCFGIHRLQFLSFSSCEICKTWLAFQPHTKVGRCPEGQNFMQKVGVLQYSFLLSGICCVKSWLPWKPFHALKQVLDFFFSINPAPLHVCVFNGSSGLLRNYSIARI